MPLSVKLREGKVLLKNGKVSCTCCEGELAITYDWRGTGQTDLDSNTVAFGQSAGYNCGVGGSYVAWLQGGGGPCAPGESCDDVSTDGFERVDVRVDTAKQDGLWTSSYNVECYAGWYAPQGGTGSFVLRATYRGQSRSVTISDPGPSSSCVTEKVATITVFANAQPDGFKFKIIPE